MAVAEGVEDQPTLDHLAHLGCDTIQGYYLSRPLPGPEATRWLLKQPGTGPTARVPTTFSR